MTADEENRSESPVRKYKIWKCQNYSSVSSKNVDMAYIFYY